MSRFLLALPLALGCATAAATPDPSAGQARSRATKVEADAPPTDSIHVSAELVPLAQTIEGRALPARLALRNDGDRPVVLLFTLPGTRWLVALGANVTITRRVEPGDTVCLDQSPDRVRLEPGQVWTRELKLGPVMESWTENFVGVSLRIPVILADRPCARVRFVQERIKLVVGAGAAQAAGPSICEWPAFAELSDRERERRIGECAPQRQLELYVKARYSTRPPSSVLLDEVASLGARVVPAIVKRLERPGWHGDFPPGDLIAVLARMEREGHYSVRTDSKLLAAIERALAGLPDSYERDSARHALVELKTGKRPVEDLRAKWKDRDPEPRPVEETQKRIPALLGMLSSDGQTMLVLDALFSMRDVDRYDVAGNRELMALLDTEVAGIQEPSLRARAARYLDALRTGAPRPQAPPAAAGARSPVRVP